MDRLAKTIHLDNAQETVNADGLGPQIPTGRTKMQTVDARRVIRH